MLFIKEEIAGITRYVTVDTRAIITHGMASNAALRAHQPKLDALVKNEDLKCRLREHTSENMKALRQKKKSIIGHRK